MTYLPTYRVSFDRGILTGHFDKVFTKFLCSNKKLFQEERGGGFCPHLYIPEEVLDQKNQDDKEEDQLSVIQTWVDSGFKKLFDLIAGSMITLPNSVIKLGLQDIEAMKRKEKRMKRS